MNKEVHNTYERVLRPQHSNFIYPRNELAIVLKELKRYEESLDIFRNV
jgi:copper homeostasis protein CutC